MGLARGREFPDGYKFDRMFLNTRENNMNRPLKTAVIVGVVVLAAGAAAALSMRGHELENSIDALETDGPGPLDGMTFSGMLGPEGKPMDVADTFVFDNGTFVSKECEFRCDYPARPYQAASTSDGWSFTSTTRCPYKDATIVWNGTVEDGAVSGVATWTVRRWYWTLEKDFAFEAQLQSQPEQETATN